MTQGAGVSVRATALVGLSCLTLGLLLACAGVSPREKPDWVEGVSEEFPADQYLIGLGQADSRPAATKRAYAAVARVFKAEVRAEHRDWESYLLREARGKTQHERRLAIDQVTQVSTDKVLENVTVLDSWLDAESDLHYVLAGMNRAQAEMALLERIRELDRAASTEVDASRRTTDTLAKIRNLKQAMNHLILREAYNADLRVIRLSGQGHPPPYRVAELMTNMDELIASNLVIRVEVTGDQAEAIRRAVIEGLVQEGLPVTDHTNGSAKRPHAGEGGQRLELLVQGSARVWHADVPDPMFRYARWCSDFLLIDTASGRVVGAVSKRGREGHLSEQEAKSRATRIMQKELTRDLAKTLARYVYGASGETEEARAPAACPQAEHET